MVRMVKTTSQLKQILIISQKDDPHVGDVTRHLSSEYIFIDPTNMLVGTELSYQVCKGKLRITYAGKTLNHVSAVWYRKPREFLLEEIPVAEKYGHFAKSALDQHWYILRNVFPEALWVSDYFDIKRAENKVWQLQVAHQLGFHTPDTLMTSSSSAAKKFTKAHTSVLVKSLARYNVPESDTHTKTLYATKFSPTDDKAYAGLHVAPTVFQEAIDADIDIRVTVVGDKVFAATITSSAVDHPDSPIRDWKVAYESDDMTILPYDLPEQIARLCVEHVRALRLKFGAIDLVRDKKGNYWFLENNPNGQWAFIEDETHQPIGKAIANLLESGHHH